MDTFKENFEKEKKNWNTDPKRWRSWSHSKSKGVETDGKISGNILQLITCPVCIKASQCIHHQYSPLPHNFKSHSKYIVCIELNHVECLNILYYLPILCKFQHDFCITYYYCDLHEILPVFFIYQLSNLFVIKIIHCMPPYTTNFLGTSFLWFCEISWNEIIKFAELFMHAFIPSALNSYSAMPSHFCYLWS